MYEITFGELSRYVDTARELGFSPSARVMVDVDACEARVVSTWGPARTLSWVPLTWHELAALNEHRALPCGHMPMPGDEPFVTCSACEAIEAAEEAREARLRAIEARAYEHQYQWDLAHPTQNAGAYEADLEDEVP